MVDIALSGNIVTLLVFIVIPKISLYIRTERYSARKLTFASSITNTSYQKLPFGSGDYPDKLLYHQALN